MVDAVLESDRESKASGRSRWEGQCCIFVGGSIVQMEGCRVLGLTDPIAAAGTVTLLGA